MAENVPLEKEMELSVLELSGVWRKLILEKLWLARFKDVKWLETKSISDDAGWRKVLEFRGGKEQPINR